MSWTYELMYLPRLRPGSYVLVASRGASVAVRVYTQGVEHLDQSRGRTCRAPLTFPPRRGPRVSRPRRFSQLARSISHGGRPVRGARPRLN